MTNTKPVTKSNFVKLLMLGAFLGLFLGAGVASIPIMIVYQEQKKAEKQRNYENSQMEQENHTPVPIKAPANLPK